MTDNDDDDELLLEDHDIPAPINDERNSQSTESLCEWFVWSYLNVLVGGVILGALAIGCSLRTNKFKQRKDYSKAKKWSYVTLAVNVIATLTGLTGLGYMILFQSMNIYRPS